MTKKKKKKAPEAETPATEAAETVEEQVLEEIPEVKLVEDEEPEAPEGAEASEADALAEECASLRDQILRARAEFDNYRKRTARENELIRKRAAEGLLGDLLPVVDHLELALQHADDGSGGFVEGVKMVLKQFHDALGRHGVEAIATVGEAFDPHVHEALAHLESEEHPEDVVSQEFQKGYRVGDQILRPAKVVVSKGPATDETIEETYENETSDRAESPKPVKETD